MKRSLHISILLLLALLLNACGSSNSNGSGSGTPPGGEQEIIPGKNFFSMQAPEGYFEAFFENKYIGLSMHKTLLDGERKAEKIKFYTPEGSQRYEVKWNEPDKMKLRKPDGTLIWKVKIYEDKLKIANNEEMTDAWEVKVYDRDKIKLKRNDEELAEWRILNEQLETYVLNEQTNVSNLADPRYRGIVLMDAMPREEQWIIMAALFAGY